MVDFAPDPLVGAADILWPPEHPYLLKPVEFSTEVLRFSPWSKQREIMEAVRDHSRVAVRACHGPGKTAVAAQIALWFLRVHPNSRVITTAPTWAQVEQLLWREIRAAVTRGQRGSFPKPTTTKLELGDEWFAIGLSTNEPERFQGHHADDILLIVDEASGVAETIFEAAEGFLTAHGAKMLMVGNPTSAGGTFHKAFSTSREAWYRIHISVYDTPNLTGEIVPPEVARSLPTREWVDQHLIMWGEESPMWQVRGLGNFADSSIDTVIPLGAVEAAQLRELPADPTQGAAVIACDVARFGDDETVIVERIGQRVRIVESYQGNDLVHTADRIEHFAKLRRPHVRLVVDGDGVGGGVVDILRSRGWKVAEFHAAATAHRPLEFPNRRSEVWFELGAQMVDLDMDPDDQLAADLSSPRYTYDLKQRRVVERKDEMKKRLKRSPDRADAVILTVITEEGLGAIAPKVQGRHQGNQKTAPRDRELNVSQIMHEPM